MKSMKKLLAFALVLVMLTALSATAFAGDVEEPASTTASITINSTAPTGSVDTTSYTAYEIFKADILSTAAIDPATGTAATGSTPGKVSYYIPADATTLKGLIAALNIFDLTLSADGTRWVVSLPEDSTATGESIAAALNTDAIKAAALSSKSFAQTTPGGTATSGQVDPGYYLVTSSLGTKLVLQTLANVTVNTKNEYINDDKVAETASVTIGENVNFYIKVSLPANIDTTKPVVVHDQMAAQFAFNNDVKAYIGDADPGDTAAAYAALTYADLPTAFVVHNPGTSPDTFDITLNTTGYAGKWIVFKYSAQLLATADADGDGYVNKEFTTYSDYTTVPNEPKVKTYDFDVLKTDGTDKLDGAEFELKAVVDGTVSDTAIALFATEKGYKKADASDTTTVDATKVTTIVINSKTKNGNTNIAGFGAGTYHLVETKAPTGYNLLKDPIIITIADDGTITATLSGTTVSSGDDVLITIVNNAGTELPSTGGIGTTLFYIFGTILVLGAGVVLVTKRRVQE